MFATLRSTIVEHGSTFDAGALTAAEAVEALDDLGVVLNIMQGLIGQVAKRIDDTAAHAGSGALHAAGFVANKLQMPCREASAAIQAANQLEELPRTAAMVRAGRLSAAQAKLIAGAATANPAAEGELLCKAAEGLAPLRDACLHARAKVEDRKDRAERQRKDRSYKHWVDDDGMGAGFHRIRPEQFGPFKAAVERETDRLFREHARAQDHEPREAYAADTLVNLVLGLGSSENDDEPESKKARAVPKYNVHLLIDYGLLTDRYTHDGARCEIAGVGPVDADWARTLLGDATLDFVVVNGVDVLTITSDSRHVTKVLRTAIMIAGLECKIVGCNIRGYLELDHNHDFAKGGATCRKNLKPFCSGHHDLKSAGWILGPEDENGKHTLRPPPGWTG